MPTALIGRERELALLDRLLTAASAGTGSVLIVEGEPGIGKTALADTAVRLASGRGWATAWGGGLQSGGTPAYWPWIQILRDLGGPVDLLSEPRGNDETGQRFRMFDQVIDVLRRSSEAGLLIVVDDLQWVDTASLRLLQVLAAEAGHHQMVVLGLLRPGDADWRGETGGALAAVFRERCAERIGLGGLDDTEIGMLAESALDIPVHGDLVRAVHGRSEGNPFFALELLRLVRETGSGRGLPKGVHEAVARRLATVDAVAGRVLCQASVLGRDFTAAELARITVRPEAEVLAALETARARDLIEAAPAYRFRFAHVLTQEVAYAELPIEERLHLHAQAAAAIGDDDDRIDALAHHLRQAAPLGETERAFDVTLRAARRARDQLAYEHAAFQYAQALDLYPQLTAPPVPRHELLLQLAGCQFRSGAVAAAWESSREAADLGLAAGRFDVVADAATVVRGISNATADSMLGEIQSLCREAVAKLGDDRVRRAKVLAQLVVTGNAFAGQLGGESGREALRLAEATGDPDARFLAIQARQIELVHPDHVLERLANGERAIALGQDTGRRECLAWGHLWRLDAFWELGRRPQLRRELDEFTAVAGHMKEPLFIWRLKMIQGCMAEIEGRFDDARGLIDEARAIGRRGGLRSAEFIHMIVSARIARLTGIGAEAGEAAVRRFAEDGPSMAYSWLAVQLIALGRLDEAAVCYRIAAAAVGDMPCEAPEWLPAMATTAHLCARFHDTVTAAELYDRLLPLADREVAIGSHIGSEGPLARPLGRLAHLLGDDEAARRHLSFAVDRSAGMGSAVYEALSRFDFAVVLREIRDRAAAGHLESATGTARRLGMEPLLREAAELGAGRGRENETALSARETELADLVADGLSNREIAARLFLSERTVESHVRNILMKLGFQRRTQISAWVNRRR